MNDKLRLFGLLALLGSIVLAQGKEFWQKKDYRQWTEFECNKLLENSPWSRSYTFNKVLIEPLQSDSTFITYQVQFRSALPVRQAFVRMQQLKQKYERMTVEQQQAFDQRWEKYLGAAPPDTVEVLVSYLTNVTAYDRELASHWQTQTTATMKNFAFLITSKGELIAPLQYLHGEGGRREFRLLYPRQHNGQPLIVPQDKKVQIEFQAPRIGGLNGGRVFLEYKVDKMLGQSEVIY